MMQKILVAALAIGISGSASLRAQGQGERVTVPFSDPSRPGSLSVQLMQGSVTVRGTDRRDVLIEASGGQQDRESRNDQAASGLRRLTQRGGFSVDEQANAMRLSNSFNHGAAFTIEVPRRTDLKLSVVNGESITVDGVEGDIETSNVNGPATTLTNIAGSVDRKSVV